MLINSLCFKSVTWCELEVVQFCGVEGQCCRVNSVVSVVQYSKKCLVIPDKAQFSEECLTDK